MKRILIIDDEVELLSMVAYQFKNKGYDVETAGDGLQGLDVLKRFRPDLIIFDLNMPNMGGIEFYNELCGNNKKPHYPVMVLTARANTENMFKDFDVDGFMAKPFDINELILKAEEIIRKHDNPIVYNKFTPTRSKKVLILESQDNISNDLVSAVANHGYSLVLIKSGIEAISRVRIELPDIILANINLHDMSGDLMAVGLKSLEGITNVPIILYMPKGAKHNPQVMDKLKEKTNIVTLIEYTSIQDVVKEIDVWSKIVK